jgi:hypothetical protein
LCIIHHSTCCAQDGLSLLIPSPQKASFATLVSHQAYIQAYT